MLLEFTLDVLFHTSHELYCMSMNIIWHLLIAITVTYLSRYYSILCNLRHFYLFQQQPSLYWFLGSVIKGSLNVMNIILLLVSNAYIECWFRTGSARASRFWYKVDFIVLRHVIENSPNARLDTVLLFEVIGCSTLFAKVLEIFHDSLVI